MTNEAVNPPDHLNSVDDAILITENLIDTRGGMKLEGYRRRRAYPEAKNALVTIIRDCEGLRGLAAAVGEAGLARQLEALIHHAGARLVARHAGLAED
jgi:hypothetical protein